MTDLRSPEEVARLIAATLGYEFDYAFRDKAEWIKARGEKGGRFRDVNEPYQTDYMYAAEQVIEQVERDTIRRVVEWLRKDDLVLFTNVLADAIEAGDWKQ